MKTCRRCGRSDVNFPPDRRVCFKCRKTPLNAPDPSATPTAPEPPPTPAMRIPPPGIPDFEIEIDPLAEALHHTEQARSKRDLKREHKALVEELERKNAIIAELTAARQPPEIVVYERAKSERSDGTAIVLASDWHVEEEVNRDSVHGLNEYNLDIAKERAEMFFRNLLRLTDIMARELDINTIHIAALGDFFSGHIHDELKASTLLSPGDAARFVKGLWFSGVDFLLRESPYVLEGDFIPGNHGRMTDQVWISDPTGTSLETSAFYAALADRYYDNPRVRFNVSEHAMVYRKFYESFLLRECHGYEIKSGGGVGGITIPIIKKLDRWDIGIKASCTAIGHYHQDLWGPASRFWVNNCMIGYNGYAQFIGAPPAPPSQGFAVVHARNGGEICVKANIWLNKDSRTEKPMEAA